MPPGAADRNLGLWLMFSAALAFTIQNLAVKLAGAHLTYLHVALGRFVVGFAGMIALVRLFKAGLWGKHRLLLVLRGVVGTAGFLMQVRSVQLLPFSQSMVLFFLFPSFAALLSRTVSREPTPANDWLFIAGAFAGTVMILWSSGAEGGLSLGHLYAVAGAFCAGLVTALVRRLQADNNSFTLYFYFCLVGGLTTFFPTLVQPQGLVPDSLGLLYLAASSGLAMLGQICMNQGFRHLSAPRGGVIMMSQVVWSAVIGLAFLGEALTWRLLAGSILIVLSGVCLGLRKS